MTDVPVMVMYAGDMSRETVHVTLMISSLNVLRLMTANLMNANVTDPTPTRE